MLTDAINIVLWLGFLFLMVGVGVLIGWLVIWLGCD